MRALITTAATTLLTAAAVGGAGAAYAADGATEIHLAPGSTSGEVSGQLSAGADEEYTFDARAGQTAVVHFEHSSPTERWTLVGPQGSPLHTTHTEQQDDATVALPSSGTYRVDVQTTDAGTYTLDLAIPAEIRFAPGSTSGTVSGQVPADGTRDYVFDARAGQTAVVHFGHSSPTARWTLVGPDGTPLHTAQTEQTDDVTVTLPGSGTYQVQVQSTDASSYEFQLSIPA